MSQIAATVDDLYQCRLLSKLAVFVNDFFKRVLRQFFSSVGIFLVGFNNNTALLAPVTDLPHVFRFDRFKIIALFTIYFVTLRAIFVMQVFGIDGQVAVAAPQHFFLFRQQNQGEVSA